MVFDTLEYLSYMLLNTYMALGVYPVQKIKQLLDEGHITDADYANLQPSSLDLSLSDEAYRMKGIFLPRKNESVSDIIREASIEKISLDDPLLCQEVYLIRLNEAFSLPDHVYGYVNNKSSSGRLNLQARLLANGTPSFDYIPHGYSGAVWLVISPQSFNIKLYPGDCINQVLFRNGDTRLYGTDYETISKELPLMYNPDGTPLPITKDHIWPPSGLTMTINLDQEILGYTCMPTQSRTLDFRNYEHDQDDFFEVIPRNTQKEITLQRGAFYIFSTYEYIRVPNDYAVEMIPYDSFKGEFRSHYAGFFDPGFGFGEQGELKGTPGVLEVLSYDNDFYIKHRQPICTFVYERLTQLPDYVYGSSKAGSHYQKQRGPQLSKHFKKKQ